MRIFTVIREKMYLFLLHYPLLADIRLSLLSDNPCPAKSSLYRLVSQYDLPEHSRRNIIIRVHISVCKV